MKFHLWGWHLRFILVNQLNSTLNIVTKDHFFVTWETGNFSALKEDLLLTDMQSSFFFSLRVWGTEMSSLLTFPFSSGSKLWIGMCWGQVLVLKYLCAECIPPIFFKCLDWGQISVLVWVHLAMTYHLNETLKTSFGFGSQ